MHSHYMLRAVVRPAKPSPSYATLAPGNRTVTELSGQVLGFLMTIQILVSRECFFGLAAFPETDILSAGPMGGVGVGAVVGLRLWVEEMWGRYNILRRDSCIPFVPRVSPYKKKLTRHQRRQASPNRVRAAR